MKTISVILLSAALAPAGFSLTSCHRQTTANPELMSVDVAYPTEDSVMIYKTYQCCLKLGTTSQHDKMPYSSHITPLKIECQGCFNGRDA